MQRIKKGTNNKKYSWKGKPPLSLHYGIKDKNVETGQNDYGSQLSCDKRGNTVKNRIVPEKTLLNFVLMKKKIIYQIKVESLLCADMLYSTWKNMKICIKNDYNISFIYFPFSWPSLEV